MSTKSYFSILAALAALLLLSGCITTETTVTLNPDGSGTIEYTSHYDRASEEVRKKIRARMAAPNTKMRNSKEDLLEDYPVPHFEIVTVEHDLLELRSKVVLRFKDINALLIRRKQTDLGLNALDFEVDGERLLFSVKEKKVARQWPEKFDDTPGLERISVIHATGGEKIIFSRELNSKTPLANWSAPLAFPGRRIIRTPDLQIFRDYPVEAIARLQIETAKWTLDSDAPLGRLDLKTTLPLPQDGYTYLYWKNPAVLSGHFFPDLGNASRLRKVGLLQNYYPSPVPFLELGFAAPDQPIESISPSIVRLEAVRGRGIETVKVGLLEPNIEYAFDGYILKITDLADNKLEFALTGDSRRVKNAILQTRRGNRFVPQRAGYGASMETTHFRYFETIPLVGCTLYLELYHSLEPCYLDVVLPSLDLSQRNWKKDKEAISSDWKKQVIDEYPDLAETKIPPVDATLFEDKAAYTAYFEGLRDEQLLPAILQIVDLMVQHNNPQNAQSWIQGVTRPEFYKRKTYLETNRPQITDRFFSIYAHTPEQMICLPNFFSVLQLHEFSQPKAVEMLQQGELRFAQTDFFGKTLTEKEIAVLKQAFEIAKDDWTIQDKILLILSRAKCMDDTFSFQILEDRLYSEYARSKTLRILMKSKNPDYALAEQIALDTTEESPVRRSALNALMGREPFPSEALLACLSGSDCRNDAVNALGSFMEGFLRDHSSDVEACAKMEKTLQPFIPWLKDISDHPTEWKARNAVSVLSKIEKLRTPQNSTP